MKYKHYLINKFINIIVKRGKKFKALLIFLNLMTFFKKNNKQKPLKLLIKIITNVKPTLTYTKLRRGSKIIYLPKLLSNENQIKQGINWIINFSKKNKKNKIFGDNLIKEILLILDNKGEVLKEKQKIYYLLIDSRPYLNLIKFN